MAKGNVGNTAQQSRPNQMRRPGTPMASSASGSSRPSSGMNDLLSSITKIANTNYNPAPSNLQMNNPYMMFGSGGMNSGAMVNPWASYFSSMYSPQNRTDTVKSTETPAPTANTNIPKVWNTGDEALSHINSQLTRNLDQDQVGRLKSAINYSGGPVNEGQMTSIMDLIRQSDPSLLRGLG